MAVITQEYDIDLKATGWYPVVEMSQYDTGSRTVVLRVYDGSDLVPLDGCVARIDGRRSDGVEFSASCTIGANSTVSFVVSQEMTRAAGKQVAELVIIDAQGNTAGTQNFILDVEPASMLRDAAASADDRTLYDQYTASIEKKFGDLSNSVNRTVEDISQVIGTGSKPVTVIKQGVEVGKELFTVRLDYDPVTALVTCRVDMNGISGISQSGQVDNTIMKIPADYLPPADAYNTNNEYVVSFDSMQPLGTGRADNATEYVLDSAGNLIFRIRNAAGDSQLMYSQPAAATWYARGGKYMGVETIGTGGNTIKVGSVTTGAAGTQATVTNSGTAKDVVLDFTIPRGADGSGSGGGFDPATFTPVTIGNGATATGDQSTVVGESVASAGDYATAIGHGASTSATGATAIGCAASAQGEQSVAIGFGALATEEHTVSVGNSRNVPAIYSRIVNVANPTADQDAATKSYVDTKVASAGGSYTLPAATATTLGGIKVGSNLSITSDGTLSATGGSSSGFNPATFTPVTIGNGASGTGDSSIVVGVSATSTGGRSTVLGTSAIASSFSVAVGDSANGSGGNSIAVGYNANSQSPQGIAIGPNSAVRSNSQFGVAIGTSATVSSMYGVAIGYSASCNSVNSVALGNGSTLDKAGSSAAQIGVVSVGNSTGVRQIVNVAAPTTDHSAANKAYVDSVCASLASLISDLRARVTALENK